MLCDAKLPDPISPEIPRTVPQELPRLTLIRFGFGKLQIVLTDSDVIKHGMGNPPFIDGFPMT